jgi:hypothetical protein
MSQVASCMSQVLDERELNGDNRKLKEHFWPREAQKLNETMQFLSDISLSERRLFS